MITEPNINELLISYLKLGSADGNIDRQKLRSQLCESLGYSYDKKRQAIAPAQQEKP